MKYFKYVFDLKDEGYKLIHAIKIISPYRVNLWASEQDYNEHIRNLYKELSIQCVLALSESDEYFLLTNINNLPDLEALKARSLYHIHDDAFLNPFKDSLKRFAFFLLGVIKNEIRCYNNNLLHEYNLEYLTDSSMMICAYEK